MASEHTPLARVSRRALIAASLTRAAVAPLASLHRASAGAIVTGADLTALPEPVRRWLPWAGVVTARPAVIRLTQEGRFRQGEDQGWMPFRWRRR